MNSKKKAVSGLLFSKNLLKQDEKGVFVNWHHKNPCVYISIVVWVDSVLSDSFSV